MDRIDRAERPLSRRRFLTLAGAGVTGGLLSACQAPVVQTNEVERVVTAPPPAEVVTLKVWDTEFEIAPFRKAFDDRFTEAYPNIQIQTETMDVSRLRSATTLAFRSGEAPDIFQFNALQLPSLANVVAEGYVQPIDDYMSEEWKQRFPEGSFQEGSNVFDGKIYSWPWEYTKAHNSLHYFNPDLFVKAGLDPDNPPTTWGELRAAAKAITEAGQGQFWGYINEGKETWKWADLAGRLAETAGGATGNGRMDYKTGMWTHNSEPFYEAIDFLMALLQDGSTYPGLMSLGDGEGRPPLAQGKVGLQPSGIYCLATFLADFPGFEAGVFPMPVPDTGRQGYLGASTLSGSSKMAVSKQCKNVEAAATYIDKGISSFDFYADVFMGYGRGLAPYPQMLTEEYIKNPTLLKIAGFIMDEMKIRPSAAARNTEVQKAEAKRRSQTPNFGAIVAGTFAGEVTDYKAELKAYDDKLNADLDRAIEEARAEGAEVSRDCYVFSNWDNSKDYTDADYEALPACGA